MKTVCVEPTVPPIATEIDQPWISLYIGDHPEAQSNSKIETNQNVEVKSSRSLVLVWRAFLQTTSGHGFARVVDHHEPLWLRLFWGLALLILSVGLLTSVFLISYDSFVDRSVMREFIIQHNETMQLPAIHICDTSLFNRTVLRKLGFNDTMASYLALTSSPMLARPALKDSPEMRKQLRGEFDRIMEGKSVQSIYEQVTLKCEDIILGCTHETLRYSSKKCCKEIFGNRHYVTDLGAVCVSTHNQPLLEEIFASQVYGFTVFLRTNTHDRYEYDASIISRNVVSRSGIIYAISDHITAVNPIIKTAGHYSQPGMWTSVSISLTRIDKSNLHKGILSPRSCVPLRSKPHLRLVPFHSVYSRRNCIMTQTRLIIEEKFNCSLFRFQKMGKYPSCHPDVMIGAYSPNLAHLIKKQSLVCPEDCIEDDYHASASMSKFNLGDHDDLHDDEEHDDRITHSAIHFFFPSFSFTVIKDHPKSLVKWLSDVGGNMSLYLGASLVTVLEFLVLFFRCVHCPIR